MYTLNNFFDDLDAVCDEDAMERACVNRLSPAESRAMESISKMVTSYFGQCRVDELKQAAEWVAFAAKKPMVRVRSMSLVEFMRTLYAAGRPAMELIA